MTKRTAVLEQVRTTAAKAAASGDAWPDILAGIRRGVRHPRLAGPRHPHAGDSRPGLVRRPPDRDRPRRRLPSLTLPRESLGAGLDASAPSDFEARTGGRRR
ncbi:hypothetical protein GCM10018779_09940 [Streptomyces griseocarneus]|nr:hypothetical protein GCM10018779_09940 [Streptomyces griseocarneus]